jgi:hypothetical protein
MVLARRSRPPDPALTENTVPLFFEPLTSARIGQRHEIKPLSPVMRL